MPDETTTTAEPPATEAPAAEPENKGPRRIGLLRQPPRKPARPRGRPQGSGSRIEAEARDAARADAQAEKLAEPGPRMALPAFAPPLVEDEEKPPHATAWPERLKLMFKTNGIMIEDFDMNSSAFTRYVTQAEQGVESAQATIEPVRQALLEMMGRDLHMRHTQIRDPRQPDRLTYKQIPDPKHPGQFVIEQKERSRWGVRSDDIVGNRGKQPRPGAWYDMVFNHFYALASMLDFLPKVARIAKSRNITRDIADAIKEAHAERLDPATNPLREAWLEMLRPIIEDGANTAWDGLN